MYIDVTEHAAPGKRADRQHQPRAMVRRVVEPRGARHGCRRPPGAGAAAALPRRVRAAAGGVRRRRLLLALVTMFVSLAAGHTSRADAYLPPLERVDDVRYLDQGWGPGADRRPAGVLLHAAGRVDARHPLQLVHQPRAAVSRRALRRSGSHAASYGSSSIRFRRRRNPDRLPVGFAQPLRRRSCRRVLDITCSACHTGQLDVHARTAARRRVRIDGGQAMHAFTDLQHGHFVPDAGRRRSRHAGQPDQVQPLCARACSGPSHERRPRALRRQTAATSPRARRAGRGTHVAGTGTRPRKATAAPTRSRASPTPCSAITSTPANYRSRQRPGQLPVRVEHLEVRLGAVQRVGQPADGAQHRRGDGHRRHICAASIATAARPAERALPLVDLDREPARASS